MLCCELSASSFCARVERGTNSMLRALTPCRARSSTSSVSLNGSRKLMCTAPCLSSATSSAGGLRTRSTMSASPSAAARSLRTAAPTFS